QDVERGSTFARFRLSTQTGLSFGGAAPDGEVEDYQVEIQSTAISVQGLVFDDVNENGRRELGEPGLQNWQVYADLNNNGVLNFGEPSTVTNNMGR
ncbi:MAG: hypothetical protein GTO04_04845, partial [Planctomycetales bacterium]|nr:hypothetical protein [Planctomycetales bacterium]